MSARVQDTSRQEKQGQPYTRKQWRNLARIRQGIIDKQARIISRQDQTIEHLTASVVQLENDYDLVESELKSLLKPRVPIKTSRQW